MSTLKRLKRGDDKELERNGRWSLANSSGWPWRQKKKEEQDWRMMLLPNGSGWPCRWTKKEKQDWKDDISCMCRVITHKYVTFFLSQNELHVNLKT